jgi:putative ABC transport system permease protein
MSLIRPDLLHVVLYDLRLAARSLRRSPAFVFAAGLSLSLAIAAGVAGFSVIDAIRFRALPFPAADRLVLIAEVPKGGCPAPCTVRYKTFALLRDHKFQSIDAIAGFSDGPKALGTGENQTDLTVSIASRTLFSMVGAKPEHGRIFTPDEDKLGASGTMIIGHDLWMSRFGGDTNVLGKSFILSDEPFTIIGIMPPGFDFESKSEAWLAATRYMDPRTGTTRVWTYVIARLVPGATMAQLTGELRTLEAAANEGRPDKARTTFGVEPLRSRYVNAAQSHDIAFAAIVGAILLIACANVASLVLVRAMRNRRELAVRSAIGASGARLASYVFAQNLLLTMLGLVVGLALAGVSLGALRALTPIPPVHVSGTTYNLDARAVAFALTLSLVMAGVLSIAPLRLLARTELQQTLREGALAATMSRGGSRTQGLFVIVQAACAVALLIGTGLMIKTVSRFGGVQLGYDASNVVQITPVPAHAGRVKERYLPLDDRLLADFATLPGVELAALRTTVPFGLSKPGEAANIVIDDSRELPTGMQPRTAFGVSPDYFAVMGIPILHGRAFTLADVADSPPVAIINEWAAEHWWPGSNPVGRSFSVDTATALHMTMTVVGVARDNLATQSSVLLAKPGAEVYRPFSQANFFITTFFARTHGSTGRLVDDMQKHVMRLVPNGKPPSGTLLAQLARQLDAVRAGATQIGGFAIIGLLLAITGLYGVLSYIVQQRTQEIGIRGVLGASPSQILGLILTQALWLAAIGVIVGLAIAALAMRFAARMLYGTPPVDLVVYAGVIVLFLAVALVASYFPAQRATRVDPAIALRAG